MKLTLMGRKRFNELPEDILQVFEKHSDETLVLVNSILQGGVISAGYSRQKEILPFLKTIYKDIQSIDGVWDFVDHTNKIYIDSKSRSYDNNTPVDQVAHKYIEANKENYDMLFVITNSINPNDVSWPIDKYKELGINIKRFQEMTYG